MKEGLKNEYTTRLIMMQKSELNAKNKGTATGALAIPVLRYSFWYSLEIRRNKT
jgi:hypothetical protein